MNYLSKQKFEMNNKDFLLSVPVNNAFSNVLIEIRILN